MLKLIHSLSRMILKNDGADELVELQKIVAAELIKQRSEFGREFHFEQIVNHNLEIARDILMDLATTDYIETAGHPLAYIGKFCIKYVTNANNMFTNSFYACYGNRAFNLDLSNWDTSNVETMSAMFSRNPLIRSINCAGWNMKSANNICNMFANCYKLETLTMPFEKILDIRFRGDMLKNCKRVEFPKWLQDALKQ